VRSKMGKQSVKLCDGKQGIMRAEYENCAIPS